MHAGVTSIWSISCLITKTTLSLRGKQVLQLLLVQRQKQLQMEIQHFHLTHSNLRKMLVAALQNSDIQKTLSDSRNLSKKQSHIHDLPLSMLSKIAQALNVGEIKKKKVFKLSFFVSDISHYSRALHQNYFSTSCE